MLISLAIRDLAVVSSQSLELGPGLTVLSGETGAGKSILIDALLLAMGARADRTTVRTGAARADISAVFDISERSGILDWLAARELDAQGECLLRRVVGADGRSRGFVNGAPVPIATLTELGALLVDIHGQNTHQSLAAPVEQLRRLDHYGALQGEARALADCFAEWAQANELLQRREQSAQARAEHRDLLRFQVDELDELALGTDEFEQLGAEHARLSNLERLLSEGGQSMDALDADDGPRGQLATLAERLRELAGLDAGLEDIAQTVNGAVIALDEAGSDLRRYLDRLETDDARIQTVEQRLDCIHTLARKHRVRAGDLFARHAELAAELADLDAGEQGLDTLRAQVEALAKQYDGLAAALGRRRREAALGLSAEVEALLGELGMSQARLAIEFEPRAERSATGTERARFMVATNPGHAPGPIHKIASGGELSRISLALQVATVAASSVPTLIFDEVDAGVGGRVAEQVGRLLRRLGANRQVLCVTHLPQVAVHGHAHLRVDKQVRDGRTETSVQTLEPEQRTGEIARMLGGAEITEQTRAHAAEMLERAHPH
ncbi:MAG: DNA repair protein RecN [Chromatiales bacterium]|nr:DNA repair protein RecN [Chromatiales bacterium]